MKWMGFGYRDLMAMPDSYYMLILEAMHEEWQRYEEAKRK